LGPNTVEIGHAAHLIVFFGLWISTKVPKPVKNIAEKCPIWKSGICSTGDLRIVFAHESLITLPIKLVGCKMYGTASEEMFLENPSSFVERCFEYGLFWFLS
jgi:hypothetical protein